MFLHRKYSFTQYDKRLPLYYYTVIPLWICSPRTWLLSNGTAQLEPTRALSALVYLCVGCTNCTFHTKVSALVAFI